MIVRELLTLVGYKVDKQAEQKASKSFEWLKGKAQELGLVLGAGAVVLGFKRMVDAASDAEETLNVVSTAFGDQSDMVLDWAKTHAKAAGRSQYSLREYAAALGQVLSPTLQNDKATADLSTSLAELTVDLASFNNETEEDTLGALRSGLIGSYEPLQRFGVVMNVAALETFAAAKGIRKKMKDMSDAEKVQLRYRFIMERTANAQGDAIRTAGGYANMTKRLGGVLKDLQINMGKLFLPVMISVIEALVSLTNAVGEFVDENRGPLKAAISATANAFRFVAALLRGLYEASGLAQLGFAGLVIGVMALNTSMRKLLITKALLFAKFILIAAVVAGVIVILDDLWKSVTTGEGVLAGFVGELGAVAAETDSYAIAIGRSLGTALDYWIEYFTGVKGASQPVTDWLYDWFTLPGELLGAIVAETNVLVQNAIRTVGGWIRTLNSYVDDFVAYISDIAPVAAEFIAQSFESIWPFVVMVFEGIADDIESVFESIWTAIEGFFVGIANAIDTFVGPIHAAIMDALTAAFDAISEFIADRVDFWLDLFQFLKFQIIGIWDTITASVKGAIDSIVTWFSDRLAPIIEQIKTAVEFWQGTFGGVTKFVGEVATDIGQAIGAIDAPAATPGGQLVAAAAGAPPMMLGPQFIAPPAAGRAGGDVNATQSIEVNVNAPGGDGPGIAAAVAPAVGRAAADSNRRTAQQLLIGGAT